MNLEKLAWLGDTSLAHWVISSATIWPALESIHFVSLCIFMGGLLVIDLRLIGYYRDRFTASSYKILPVVLIAFATNLITGICFFAGNAYKYIDNPAFELKLLLMMLAGLNALFYQFRLPHLLQTEGVTRTSVFVGYLSLAIWASVIVCGRMITFFAP